MESRHSRMFALPVIRSVQKFSCNNRDYAAFSVLCNLRTLYSTGCLGMKRTISADNGKTKPARKLCRHNCAVGLRLFGQLFVRISLMDRFSFNVGQFLTYRVEILEYMRIFLENFMKSFFTSKNCLQSFLKHLDTHIFTKVLYFKRLSNLVKLGENHNLS